MERKTALVPGDLLLLQWLASIALFLTMVVTFVDVVGRYALSRPIYGSAEMIQLLMATTIFAGLGLVSDRDGHIAVDLFEGPLARWCGRWRLIVIGLVSAAGLALIGVELGRIGLDALATGRRSIVLGWSTAWFSLPGAVLCLFAGLVQLERTIRRP